MHSHIVRVAVESPWWQTLVDIGSPLIALIAAGVALYVALHGWSRQDAAARDAEAGQARLVTLKGGPQRPPGGFEVVNYSQEPVFDVRVVVSESPNGAWRWRPYIANEPALDVLLPGRGHPMRAALEVPRAEAEAEQIDEWPTFGFTDIRGKRWTRRYPDQPRRLLTDQ